MTSDETSQVVGNYHRAWTSKNFEEASGYLAPDLQTEVPLNTYHTKEEFVEALTGFGQLVTDVELLAEFSSGDEAMVLYDMVVEPIGTIRIAEHFTVTDGHISRIRHVHDTAELRATGFAANDA